MGTSAARQAPTGKLWRAAKTYASRFASGQGASPPQAAEVIARYSAALQSLTNPTGGEPGHFVPEVARTAAALGNFYRLWEDRGWEAALIIVGVAPVPPPAFDTVLPHLLDRLAGPGATLDQAVARIALLHHGQTFLASAWQEASASGPPPCPDSRAGVSNFLGLALFQRMLADLGEPLEFHAPTLGRHLEGQTRLQAQVMTAMETVAAGLLAGDSSFSQARLEACLEGLLVHLKEKGHG